jgi:hypothetical protein
MAKSGDSEGLAIFAEIVEIRSFAGAAVELKRSKVTVSKAVSRIEAHLGGGSRARGRLLKADRGDEIVAPSWNRDDVAMATLAVAESAAQSAHLNL